jgi:hypothetical protein
MSVDDISLSSEISYHHSSQFVFYSILLFYSLIEVGFSLYYCALCYIYLCECSFYIASFISFSNKLNQWYQSNMILVVSGCMSPMRSGYRELGLELVSLGDDCSH